MYRVWGRGRGPGCVLVRARACNVHRPCHDGADSANPSVLQESVPFGTPAEVARRERSSAPQPRVDCTELLVRRRFNKVRLVLRP